jgi:membrane protease subunit HflK
LLGFLALLLVGLGAGFHQVGVGEQAVVLRAGRLHDVQGQGLHWNIPLLDSVRTVSVARVRDATLTADVITRDEGLLTLGVVLHYRVTDPEAYLLQFADAEAALLRLAESVVQEAAADMALQELAGAAGPRLAPVLEREIARRLAGYRSGIALSALDIASVLPPTDLRTAFADVQRAGEEAKLRTTRAQAEVRQTLQAARSEAARQREAAERESRRQVEAARQQAAEFAEALTQYRRDPAAVEQQMYAEAVSDVLGRTRTVIVGEGGLAQLGIPPASLGPAPLPPAPRKAATGQRP